MSNNQTNAIFPNMGSSEDHEGEPSFWVTHYTVLAVATVLATLLLVVVSFWLREVCFDRFGIEVCSGSVSTARRREIRRFQLRALQLQREMERDLQDSSASKQQERKEIYGAFLQKFGKVGLPCISRMELCPCQIVCIRGHLYVWTQTEEYLFSFL